ncbi:MAG: DUF2294 family protein [Caldilinea sp. CFX5]|nr:DUF2294 family protein [Caldilinea sp. CFX5]
MKVNVQTENGAVTNALPQIAQVFLVEWSRLRTQPGVKPQAHLTPDRLTIEIRNALTARERSLLKTAAGRILVKRVIDQWIDAAYPRLAGQIESLLNCYITSTGIELGPDEGCVRVQIGLRRTPTLMM